MQITVYQNRQAIQTDNEVYGTQNENNVTTLEIEVPEKYEHWNKRIVFITDDGNLWDIIVDNTYIIKNNITKYKEVEAYIWLTENADAEKESVSDFRSQIFKLSFFDNVNADNLIVDEKKTDGFNSMLTVLNAEIEQVKELNEEFTRLKNDVEQAETERNKKVDDAISNIKDLQKEYDNNAIEKLNEYNKNTEKKIKEYDDNAIKKTTEYNELAEQKEAELDDIAEVVRDLASAMQYASFRVNTENMQVQIKQPGKMSNARFRVEKGNLEVKVI